MIRRRNCAFADKFAHYFHMLFGGVVGPIVNNRLNIAHTMQPRQPFIAANNAHYGFLRPRNIQ